MKQALWRFVRFRPSSVGPGFVQVICAFQMRSFAENNPEFPVSPSGVGFSKTTPYLPHSPTLMRGVVGGVRNSMGIMSPFPCLSFGNFPFQAFALGYLGTTRTLRLIDAT